VKRWKMMEYDEYIRNRYEDCVEQPDPDMSFLEKWEGIISYADEAGAETALNDLVCPRHPVSLEHPEKLKIEIYDSFAGKLPVIYVPDAPDFEQLVTNVAHKGVRPDNLSETGAIFLSGKTTRFMILSSKPYSNVPAAELGVGEEDWQEKSLMLRRGHECTHYFTKQKYGIAENLLHDELMADFIGIYEAFGYYRAEFFLRFMGVMEGSGNRMVYYTADLDAKDKEKLSGLLREAAGQLESWSKTETFASLTTKERISTMCMKGLSGIAEGFETP
jgi:hypothetical protein